MRLSRYLRLSRWLAVGALCGVFAGCRQKPVASPATIAEPCVPLRHGFATSRYRVVRDSLARLVPGFAGLYRDGPQETLHVNVTSEGDEALALRVLLPYAQLIRHPKGAFVVVHRVEYSWLQLANWRCTIESSAALASYLGLGIDEKANVIRFDVRLGSDTASTRDLLESMQIPRRAVRIRLTPMDTARHRRAR